MSGWGKLFFFYSALHRYLLGIITPTRVLTCLYILFQLVAMQIDLPLYLNSVTRAVFLVLVKFSRSGGFPQQCFPKCSHWKKTFPRCPTLRGFQYFRKPVCCLPPLRESLCKLVYQKSLRIPALKKKSFFLLLLSPVFLKIYLITEPAFVDRSRIN